MASGEAAALVSAFPGAAVHELPGWAIPSGGAAATVPVALPLTAPTIITGIAGGRTIGWLVLEVIGAAFDMGVVIVPSGLAVMVPTGFIAAAELAETPVLVEVTLITDGESATAVGEQLRLVPGIVGSRANGGEASVVAGAPGTVAAEKRLVNGLGPPRGDDTIAPGVDGSASCVVPMVDICAMQLPLPSKSTIIAQKIRMSNLLLASAAFIPHEFAGSGCGATLAPSARSTIGLRMTRSPALRPCSTTTCFPRSRAIEIFCR